MKNSTKGALFSGLVFPGLGQVVLQRKRRGAAIMVAVLACITLFVMKALEVANAILENMELTGGLIDMNSISDAANQASAMSGDLVLNGALLVILVLWLFATIDAYSIGKKLD